MEISSSQPQANLHLRGLQMLIFGLLLVLMVLLAWNVGNIAAEQTALFAGQDSDIEVSSNRCYADCAFIQP